MASLVRWQPQNLYVPCRACGSGESVFWPARLATRTDLDDERGRLLDIRRNDECPHEQQAVSSFTKTHEDDPSGEWRDIDWDPPDSV